MTFYLERYRKGEYTQVWAELLALGDRVREEPIYADAWAVALETMRRVRYNIDQVLIPRLQEIGFVFGYGWADASEHEWGKSNEPLRTPPPPNIIQLLADFEHQIGPLPLSILAFYQEVGGVNFMGYFPDEQTTELTDAALQFYLQQPGTDHKDYEGFDPLAVYGPKKDFFAYIAEHESFDPLAVYGPEDEYTDLADELQGILEYCNLTPTDVERIVKTSPQKLIYHLVIAPDSYHKINVSGGGPYEIIIPNASADAPLQSEWHQTTFVDYLRICCHWAGLPGLEGYSELSAEEWEYLRKALLPF